MITYELAKELKEAGFPMYQRAELGTRSNEGESPYEGVVKINGLLVSIPNLSEIIAECREDFSQLIKNEESWTATPTARDGYFECMGKSPEEAVIRLYISLNKSRQ